MGNCGAEIGNLQAGFAAAVLPLNSHRRACISHNVVTLVASLHDDEHSTAPDAPPSDHSGRLPTPRPGCSEVIDRAQAGPSNHYPTRQAQRRDRFRRGMGAQDGAQRHALPNSCWLQPLRGRRSRRLNACTTRRTTEIAVIFAARHQRRCRRSSGRRPSPNVLSMARYDRRGSCIHVRVASIAELRTRRHRTDGAQGRRRKAASAPPGLPTICRSALPGAPWPIDHARGGALGAT